MDLDKAIELDPNNTAILAARDKVQKELAQASEDSNAMAEQVQQSRGPTR